MFSFLGKPSDGMVEAEYFDGYVHSEHRLKDNSPYLPNQANVMSDIVKKRPVADHGELVRFSVWHNGTRYDEDPMQWPNGAIPARYKRMEADQVISTDGRVKQGKSRMVGLEFGYEKPNGYGQMVKEVELL